MKELYFLSGVMAVTLIAALSPGLAEAQTAGQKTGGRPASQSVVTPPPDYVIGADDALNIVFWREQDMSAEVVVRPDGHISLPLLNDVKAVGLTPEQLRVTLNEAAKKFVEEPNATVVVRAINSRRVFVQGSVMRGGPYPLSAGMTVLQALALAGGVTEFANAKNISVVRNEDGASKSFKFNYKDVLEGKNLQQNIVLRPGDSILVP
jgi:polysaccharide biosynthesis/export protein